MPVIRFGACLTHAGLAAQLNPVTNGVQVPVLRAAVQHATCLVQSGFGHFGSIAGLPSNWVFSTLNICLMRGPMYKV